MLELKGISKVFNRGEASENRAIDNLSLTIEPGEFVTVIGGNGAGKSTMLNIISGAIQSDTGLLLLNECNIDSMSEHRRAPYFGRVFQDPMMGTAADMTILENLTLAYGRGRVRSPFRWSTKKEDKEFFIEQLKTLDLGLEDRIHQKVGLLSGGQRQALTLLMATIRRQPSIRSIKRDYVRFYMGDKEKAKETMLNDLKTYKEEYLLEKKENRKSLGAFIKSLEGEDSQIKRMKIKAKKEEPKKHYLEKVAKYDLTKQILLLDEHTAALDPKTAQKVLELTDEIVKRNGLTTVMITHNMKDAIKYGNRLIMMSKGKVVVDIEGEKKKKLTVNDLMDLFQKASANDFLSDSTILGD